MPAEVCRAQLRVAGGAVHVRALFPLHATAYDWMARSACRKQVVLFAQVMCAKICAQRSHSLSIAVLLHQRWVAACLERWALCMTVSAVLCARKLE